jgi:c(7)-type cytochrome triheme protein
MKTWWGSLLVAAVVACGAGAMAEAPGDIEFEREGEAAGPVPPAVFTHWRHRIRYRCYVCHPRIFNMEAGSNKITMKSIGKGEWCGVCHNGKTAFKVDFKNCARCHFKPGSEEAPAEAPAPEAAPKPPVTPAPVEAPAAPPKQ